MAYYSTDLRQKALNAYASGFGTQQEVCQYFQISLSSFKRWLQRQRAGLSLEAIIEGKGRKPTLGPKHLKAIEQAFHHNNSITLRELSVLMASRYKLTVGNAVLCRALQQLNLRHKKLTIQATEKDFPEVKKKESIISKTSAM